MDNLIMSCSASTTASTTDCFGPLQYTGPNFQEWLLVTGLIVFLLSFPLWRRMFSPIDTIINK